MNYKRMLDNIEMNKKPIKDFDRSKELSTQTITPYQFDKGKPISTLAGVFQGTLSVDFPKKGWKDPKAIFLDCNTGLLVWIPVKSETYQEVLRLGIWPGDSLMIVYTRLAFWKSRGAVDVRPVIGGGFLPDEI